MDIAIIGGGFTGLTAAYELTKKGHKVTLFEKEKYLGGLAHGFTRPGWDWHLESAYHHLFTNDTAILSLIKELGLAHKLMIHRPITANYVSSSVFPAQAGISTSTKCEIPAQGRNDKILAFDSPIHLLTYPYLSILDKVRTGILLAFLKINPFWQPFESITAKKLFIALGGRRAWETIWEPLMIGKFGTYADRVAASWLWARIKKRTQKLYYIKGGFHTLVTALKIAIKNHGGTILTNTNVLSIKKHLTFDIGNLIFDRLLLTVPTPIAAKLIPHLTFDIGNLSLNIPHLHAQTLILETKEPILKNTYWLNITDRTFPFLCVVAHTNMMDKKYYGGRHLTYFGNYLPENHPFLALSAKEILKIFQPFIQRLNPHFHWSDWSDWSDLFIGYHAQPVHERFYSRRAPKLQTPIPGIYLANMDSIYPWDRGTNYAVELGVKAADAICHSRDNDNVIPAQAGISQL